MVGKATQAVLSELGRNLSMQVSHVVKVEHFIQFVMQAVQVLAVASYKNPALHPEHYLVTNTLFIVTFSYMVHVQPVSQGMHKLALVIVGVSWSVVVAGLFSFLEI